jgi:hypothetical protein
MSETPIVHGFAISPRGGPDIIVEGTNRFVREDEFLAYKAWAEAALATTAARARREGIEEAATRCEERAAYFDRTTGSWDRSDSARSYRATATQIRGPKLAATPPEDRQTETKPLERVRHVKRGTEYEVLHEGVQLQVATHKRLLDDWALALVEGDKLVVYRGDDGKLWAREESEFRDGRFAPPPPAIGNLDREGRPHG